MGHLHALYAMRMGIVYIFIMSCTHSGIMRVCHVLKLTQHNVSIVAVPTHAHGTSVSCCVQLTYTEMCVNLTFTFYVCGGWFVGHIHVSPSFGVCVCVFEGGVERVFL